MGQEYLNNWVNEVKLAQEKHGVQVCNLYSGHGTYTTLGLTHTEESVRNHMIENWFFPMVRIAGMLNCGMGFFAHAFNHSVLQNVDDYEDHVRILEDALANINDTRGLLTEVSRKSGHGFYFTEDVGHHHPKFIRPTKEQACKN